MRSHGFFTSSFFVIAACAIPALADWKLNSAMAYREDGKSPLATPLAQVIQSQAGYDPFQLNWRTGRFDYVPIPYDPASANDPYRFNWYNGRWDYVPLTPPTFEGAFGAARETTPSGYVDTRIDPQSAAQSAAATMGPAAGGAGTGGAGEGAAPPVYGTSPGLSQPIIGPAVSPRQPTTRATTSPISPHSPPPPMRVKLAGKWEFDYSTGQWVFVLPPD